MDDKNQTTWMASSSLPSSTDQIQTSSYSPSLPNRSNQVPIEPKHGLPTAEEFDELVNAKAQLLGNGHEREKALKDLCVLSLDHARMELYRDYMTFLAPEYEMTPEDWTQIRFHLKQYVQAENHWDKIRQGFGRKFSAEPESNVVAVAASEAIIADLEGRMSQESGRSDAQREMYNRGKKLLSSRYRLKAAANGKQEKPYAYSRDEDGSKITEFISRMKMAVFGGYVLVIPMLIMTLHPTLLTNLLTTSMFVLGVAVILAVWMTDADDKDIIGATAGYAGVLVVFVGTITTEPTEKREVVVGVMVGVMVGVPLLIVLPLSTIHVAHLVYHYYERKDEERASKLVDGQCSGQPDFGI